MKELFVLYHSREWYNGEMMKISGTVKKHKGRGKKLGFPTTNIEIGNRVKDGIYVGTVGPMELPALVFIGAAKTFGEKKRWAEVYILDFDEDIYGQKIEVELIKKIRGNEKFDSEAELVEQMREDAKVAKQYFANKI